MSDVAERPLLEPGTVIDGRWRVERLVASGGMCDVFRATEGDGAAVALKVMRWGAAREAARVLREAELLEPLRHPSIVRCLGHGTCAGDRPYLVLEWIEGETLADCLRRGPLSVGETVTLGLQTARALAVAHAAGVVHRDIKPSNLILSGGSVDAVKLIDFGIARMVMPSPESRLTQVGTVIGTPGYLSPEQARGDADVDERADLFALGCVLFRCLAGRPVFVAVDAMAVLAKILLEPAPRLRELRPDVPEAMDALVAALLSKSRRDRPPSAAHVAVALEAIGGDVVARDTVAHVAGAHAPITSDERRLLSVVAGRSIEADAPEGDAELSPRLAPLGERHGGVLESLAGGAFVVVLAGDGGATDLATRATRCALALRDELKARLAVATGVGATAAPGPVGEVIDRASVMLGGSDPGAIVIDDVTAGLLDPRFLLARAGAGFAVEGEREQIAPAPRTVLGRVTPFVGRDRELRILIDAVDECASEPVSRAVLVTGPPGVGKSRLMHELLQRIRARDDGAIAWVGRGDPVSRGAPFGVLGSCLRDGFAIRGAEPEAAGRAKVTEAAGQLGAGADPDAVLFLGEIAGVRFPDDASPALRAARRDPVLMRDRLERSWQDLLSAACARQPIVLLLEDLQWGDAPSIKFVASALRALRDAPLLVVASARPDLAAELTVPFEAPGTMRVSLAELGPSSARRLVIEVLGPTTEASTVQRIVAQAAGNALCLEELIRAHASGSGPGAPSTVLAMLHARFGQQPEEARRVLRAASVFGNTFWPGGVAALLRETRGEVTMTLDALVSSEVVARRATSRFPAETEWSFCHGLLREVAYSALPETERAAGHALAGSWLRDAGERDAMILAEHFDRGAEPELACTWYRHAAEQALGGSDLQGVRERVEHARRCGATGEALGALSLLEAEALEWQGDFDGAVVQGREALRLLPPATPSWFRAATTVATSLGHRGDVRGLLDLVETLPVEHADDAELHQTVCLARAAVRLYIAGDTSRGDRLLGAAVDLARRCEPDPVARGWLDQAASWKAFFAGDLAESFRLDSLSSESFRAAGDLRNACRQLSNAGYEKLLLGAHTEAARILGDALAESERLGLGPVVAVVVQNLCLAHHRLRALDEAIRFGQRAVELAVAQRTPRSEGFARVYLSRALVSAGRLDEAGAEASAGLDCFASSPPSRPLALAAMTEVRLARGDSVGALDAAERAMAALASLEAVDEGEALVRLVHVEALEAAGRRTEAVVALRTAHDRLLARAERLGDPAARETFLTDVPENARTIALAATLRPG